MSADKSTLAASVRTIFAALDDRGTEVFEALALEHGLLRRCPNCGLNLELDHEGPCPECGAVPNERLEYLRGEIRAERISMGEIAELQSLADQIDPGDVELLEWAGIPEFSDDDGSLDA